MTVVSGQDVSGWIWIKSVVVALCSPVDIDVDEDVGVNKRYLLSR